MADFTTYDILNSEISNFQLPGLQVKLVTDDFESIFLDFELDFH